MTFSTGPLVAGPFAAGPFVAGPFGNKFGASLPLDGLSAAAAFSTRRLRTDYTGPLLRVRRSSDNAELDIGAATEEIVRTNLAPNPNLTGGSPGTQPTNTLIAGMPAGISFQLVGQATVNGVTYYDFRVFGTATVGGTARWLLSQTNQGAAVSVGQAYTLSMDIAIAAGALTNTSVAIVGFGRNEASGPAAGGAVSSTFPITATPQRFKLTATNTGPATRIAPEVVVNTQAGNALDITIRVGRVTLEAGAAFNVTHIPVFDTPTVVVSPGDLDIAALMGHVGTTGSGFVTTRYDQSGNAVNATQTTAAQQPRIVNAGVLDTLGGKATIQYLGAQTLAAASAVSARASNIVTSSAVASTAIVFTAGGQNIGVVQLPTQHRTGPFFDGTIMSDFTDPATINVPRIYSDQTEIDGVETAWRNGTPLTKISTTLGIFTPPPTLSIASRLTTNPGSPLYYTGAISELVIFADVQATADRQTLERNQGAYYGITVA